MTVKMMAPQRRPSTSSKERQMKDKTSNGITNIIMRLFNAADGVSPLDNYFRAVVRKRFPEATKAVPGGDGGHDPRWMESCSGTLRSGEPCRSGVLLRFAGGCARKRHGTPPGDLHP